MFKLYLKQLSANDWVQRFLGWLLATYLRLVRITTLWQHFPNRVDAVVDANAPYIVAMWHGQHFMVPFMGRKGQRYTILISGHRDGNMNAYAVHSLGLETVRGSGGKSFSGRNKGGARGLLQLVRVLKSGSNVGLTADVPKISRVAGMGIVQLAKLSGRPILPVTVVCAHKRDFKTWDKASIGLPFGRGVKAYAEPIFVPKDAQDLELYRKQVENALDELHAQAYGLLGLPDPGAQGHKA